MNVFTVLLLSLLGLSAVFLASCQEERRSLMQLWEEFKRKFGKTYSSATEEEHRMNIFLHHTRKIDAHNKLVSLGLKSFTMAINEYSDLSFDEFKSMMTGHLPVRKTLSTDYTPDLKDLPDRTDWRDHGLVTPVKNQGPCGSCWAFSTTGAIEGCHARATGNLVSLSEQQLLDCSGSYGNHGCNGGWMQNAFKYVTDQKGIATEKSYPYETNVGACRYALRSAGASISGWHETPQGSEAALDEAIATVGPVSVAIDVQDSFQHYSSGVYFEPACSPSYLDHAVLAVGYGPDHYIVKNSWGLSWGEHGYIRMARKRNNNCGIASRPSYPLGCR